MNKKLQLVILGILCVAPIIVYTAIYHMLPEQVPLQFGFSCEVNRYGTKNEMMILVFMPLFLTLLMKVSRKIDPKKENYEKFAGFYEAFILVMAVFMDTVFALVLYLTFYPSTLNIGMYMILGIGLLFIFIGNYMPKAKQNFFFGIKTPWTLSSENVWIKTHRLGGICFFIAGVILLISIFLPETYMIAAILVCSVIAAVIPIVMSFVFYKKEENR